MDNRFENALLKALIFHIYFNVGELSVGLHGIPRDEVALAAQRDQVLPFKPTFVRKTEHSC